MSLVETKKNQTAKLKDKMLNIPNNRPCGVTICKRLLAGYKCAKPRTGQNRVIPGRIVIRRNLSPAADCDHCQICKFARGVSDK